MEPKHRTITGIVLAVLAFGASTVAFYHMVMDLSSPYPGAVGVLPEDRARPPADTVYVGVISRYPSSVIYRGYQPLLDYLSAETGRYFALRLGGSYEETVAQLVDGRVAAAFLGSYLYVQAHAEHGVVCVVMPLNEDGTPWARSALITGDGSDIRSVEGLRGRRLALPPELSFSAQWLLTSALAEAGLDASDLGSLRHLPHHQAAVYEVLRGNADAAVVRDRVAREFRGRGIRVVATSGPIPGAPIVVPAVHDSALVAELKGALLGIDVRDPGFTALAAGWDPEFAHGFTEARDADYDGLRLMLGLGRR